MRLDTLTVKGVLAFPEERSVNFRYLPEGLIALRGPIGHGKTTLLEGPAATIFRSFPSREKKPPFDYATGTDAFLQLVFELEGRGLYRARLNLDGLHRKQEAVLLRRDPSGEESFVSDKQSLKSYDTAIAELLPSLPDWLASILAVQTKIGSFSEASTAERRVMLQTLMGLDAYERLAERARGALTMVLQAATQAEAMLDALEREDSPGLEAALARRASDLDRQLDAIAAERSDLQREIATVEALAAELDGEARRFEAAFARHRSAEGTVALRTAERTQLEGTIDRTARDGQTERARLVQSHAEWIARNLAAQRDTILFDSEVARLRAARDTIIAEAEGRIAKNRTDLLEQGATIRAAVAELATLDIGLTAHRADAAAGQAALDSHTAAERLLIATLHDLQTKAGELARAQTDVGLLDTVPCGGVGDFAACEFLTKAQQAKDRIAALADTPALIVTASEEHTAVRLRIETARDRIETAAVGIALLERQRTFLKPTADKLPFLNQAQERITALEQRIADTHTQYENDWRAADDRSTAHVARLQAEAELQETEHVARLAMFDRQLAARLESLTGQLAGLRDAITAATAERDQEAATIAQTSDAAARANGAALTLAGARERWNRSTALDATLHAQLDALEAEVAQHATRLHRIVAQRARVARLHAMAHEWDQLVHACGREGIPTLDIDAAAPQLTDLFNDLLLASFGGRFTGQLVTQTLKLSKAKSGATHNEVIEFKIYDQLRGGAERDLHDLSGGQKIVVEEALRSAIALLVNQRSPHPMRTCWRDETTGSLDPESAVAYIAMLRRVQEIGGFYHLIYATHSPACWALADSQLIVANGDITVALPPYSLDPQDQPALEAAA